VSQTKRGKERLKKICKFSTFDLKKKKRKPLDLFSVKIIFHLFPCDTCIQMLSEETDFIRAFSLMGLRSLMHLVWIDG